MAGDSESNMMAVLASVLADPAAAASRLKDLNAAKTALELSKADHAARLESIKKIEADANEQYKNASADRLKAERALSDAKTERAKTQALLDQIANREAEVNAREERAAAKAAELQKREDAVALLGRQNSERAAALAAGEKALNEGRADLKERLEKLKALAA